MKLQGLSSKESSGEQVLDGVYRIVMDVQVTADKKITLQELHKKVAEMGSVDDIVIEKYDPGATSAFAVGDTVELTADYSCTKSVYLDTGGNLVISDKPVTANVEKVGDFSINLPKGTIAEVNKHAADNQAEILFTGESVELGDLNRVAYLGILELPCSLFIKAEL